MLENVVGDPTDPRGTLRPNLHLEIGTGDYYKLLFCPEFDRIINLPIGIDRTDPLAIWSLFFTLECLGISSRIPTKRVYPYIKTKASMLSSRRILISLNSMHT